MNPKRIGLLLLGLSLILSSYAQEESELLKEIQSLREQIGSLRHEFDQIDKGIDDLMWYNKVGDLAFIDKVRLTGTSAWEGKISSY